MKGKSMRAVWLADVHAGSRWAVADPAETPKHCAGKEIQKALYDKWVEAATGPWHAPDVLVVDGDAIDGQGRKDSGVHQWTTDITEQVENCATLLEMWQAKEIYILGGSKYHVMAGDTGLSGEEMLGQRLKAVEYPNQDHIPVAKRRRSGPTWFITFDKVTAHFSHHVAVSRVFAYMSTPIARQMMQAKLNDPMRRKWDTMYRASASQPELQTKLMQTMHEYQTRIVVRAHAHYYWSCDSGGSTGINLPSWKVPDPFIAERDPLGFGHIGFIGAEFRGEDWSFEKHLIRLESAANPPHSTAGSSSW